MQAQNQISSHRNSPLCNPEIIIFRDSEHTENQHSYFDQNDSSFTGKEKDSETGFYYFGARYMDHELMTMWLSVDPMADKCPNLSPYHYCHWNPVILIDSEGLFDIKSGKIEKGDNLSSITKIINSTYNTHLTITNIAEANGISNPNKIYAGDFIKLPGNNIELQFDMSTLKVVDLTYNITMPGLEWQGVSGRDGYQFATMQTKPNKGPIPEGYYIVNPQKTQSYADISRFDKIKGTIGCGSWPGGTKSWGEYRTWLTPCKGTNTYGRNGFSIHGGKNPGSAGCIDLTKDNNSFHNWLKSYGNTIQLNVDY